MKKAPSMAIDRVMSLNNLQYREIGDVSAIQSRMLRKFTSQNSTYQAGNTINFDLDVGTSLVYGKGSVLTFSITTVNSNAAYITSINRGKGSYAQCIQSISLIKNEKIFDEEEVGLRIYHESQNSCTDESLYYGEGTMEGYAPKISEYGTDGVSVITELPVLSGNDLETTTNVCIPMSRLAGFFNNAQQLIPGQLLNGARLQITLAQGATAFTSFSDNKTMSGVADTISYTVSNPTLHLDLFNLNDTARNHLNKKLVSKSGLVYSFTSYTHMGATVTTSGTYQTQIGQALSHCLSAFSCVRVKANITDSRVDSFATESITGDATRFRMLLGQVSYPEQKTDTAVDAYFLSKKMWDGALVTRGKSSGVSLEEFKNGNATLALSFERSHLNTLSGQPLSSSRVLMGEYTFTTAIDRQIDTFCKHVRAVSCFNGGSIRVDF